MQAPQQPCTVTSLLSQLRVLSQHLCELQASHGEHTLPSLSSTLYLCQSTLAIF